MKKKIVIFALMMTIISDACAFIYTTDIDIAKTVRRFFGFKRFASVEFSAKQAFENFNTAMILLQLFLFLTLIILIIFSIYWFRQRKYVKIAKRLHSLLHRLSCHVILFAYSQEIKSAKKLDVKTSKNQTITEIMSIVHHWLKIKHMTRDHRMLIEFLLNAIADDALPIEQQLRIIEQLQKYI